MGCVLVLCKRLTWFTLNSASLIFSFRQAYLSKCEVNITMFNWRQNDSTQSHLIGGEYRILAVIFLEHLLSIAWKYRQSLHSRTCSTTPSLLPSRLCSHASVFDLVWFGLSCFRTQLSVLLSVFSLIQSTCTDLEKWECLGNYIMNIMRPIFNIINHTYLFCLFVLFFVFLFLFFLIRFL